MPKSYYKSEYNFGIFMHANCKLFALVRCDGFNDTDRGLHSFDRDVFIWSVETIAAGS